MEVRKSGGVTIMTIYDIYDTTGKKNLRAVAVATQATPPLVLSVQAYIPAFYRAICILQAYPLYACRGDRLLVVYLCRLKVCRVCVAPFGTDLGLGKKGARIGVFGLVLENI